MDSNPGRHEINCSVHSCKYNDKMHKCTLHNIAVGSGNVPGEARTKKETQCQSFESEI